LRLVFEGKIFDSSGHMEKSGGVYHKEATIKQFLHYLKSNILNYPNKNKMPRF
jgi:hypothetical protein